MMSYPKDLDEIGEPELREELARREALRASGLCDYCGRAPSEQSCKFPKRHACDEDSRSLEDRARGVEPCKTPGCRAPGVEESAHGGYWCAACWRRVTTEEMP